MKRETPAGWERRALGDVLTLKRGYDLPARERKRGNVPVVSSAGVSGTHVDAKVTGPGVVTGRYGTIGEVFLIDGPYWPLNTVLYVQDFKGSDPRYCAELLRSINFRAYDGKSGVPGINRNDVHTAEVFVPPPPEQRRIAQVARVLDGKIDSNRRLAAILEWVTQTEFRARLVDPRETLWKGQAGSSSSHSERASLIDVADFVNGKAFTKEANGRGRPILRIRELKGGVRDDTPRSDIDVPAQHIAHDGDILFAWSGTLDVYRWSGPEALINQHIFRVLPKRPYTDWFVYEWIREHMPRFQAIARDKATTMGHIQRHHLAEAVVSVPPPTALGAARGLLDPIDRQRLLLRRENATLAAIRDALLPKLVSGQIRVPDTADPEEVTGPVAEELVA